MVRRPRSILRLCAFAAVCCLALSAPAQSGLRVITWRAADGLPQSAILGVSLDHRGNVITSHGAASPVGLFDGFQITRLPNSAGAPSRVCPSRSAQYWCAHDNGLLENTSDGWNFHPIPEIAAERRANPMRVRAIPLLPLDRNRVLFLLPDRLMLYDATDRRSAVIRAVTATGLERFSEISPSLDDGAWISGARGLLRVPGPIRQVTAETPFQEILIPPSLPFGNLDRPFENSAGAVVAAGENLDTREDAILRWSNNQWETWTLPDQNLRQAWGGPDGELWGHTAGTVFRLGFEDGEPRIETILQVGRVADIAIEPHGVAWIGTSEGLVRLAPLPWRTPPGFAPEAGPVFAVTSDRRGHVAALTSRAVHWLSESGWIHAELTATPPEEATEREHGLFRLPGEALFIQTAAGNVMLTPHAALPPPPPPIARAHPLGALPDGRILLLDQSENSRTLLAFDGMSATTFGELPPEADSIGPLHFALQAVSGELWIGGERGLLVRRGDSWSLIAGDGDDSGTDNGALAGIELPDGRIVIGGADSLREFDGRQWRVLRRGFDRVHDFELARDGALWVASGSGLYRTRDNSWFTLGEEEGLPATAVYSVFEDGAGRLWAGTGRGLWLFDLRADQDAPAAEIAGADTPERAGDTRALFIIGGQDRWRFTPPGRLSFSWKLDNNPWSAWRPIGSVQFTNLTAGTHRFSVRAMDPTGNAQAIPASVEFAVTLPWFKDPRLVWMSGAALLLLLALGAQAILSYSRLRRSYAEVERLVAVRSAALEKANAELLHSHKMRALGTLAAGVAHDFNNLLSIIKGSAQLVEAQLHDSEKARLRLQRIRTAVDQGAGLVRAMLGYSRGNAAPRKVLDAREAVARALRLFDEHLQARIRFQAPSGPGYRVHAPPEMLQQIVLNLVQNADESMDRKGVIGVEIREGPAPKECAIKPAQAARYVIITVRDSGAGIPPENLGRIFEPFFTTKGFSSRRGTGLGLSMVYEFAKELGAGIAVDSRVGEGATFEVIIPAHQKDPDPEPTAA